MNVCKAPDMCKDMEYKYITEDSKTRVYLSVVREFNEAEYEKYYIHKKKEKVRKRILFIARALKYALPVLASTILYNTGIERSGVKRIRLHDLRHSHASMLVDMGVAPLEIAERLGHEKVETTLNTYSHLYPSTQSKLAGLLDKKHEEEEE